MKTIKNNTKRLTGIKKVFTPGTRMIIETTAAVRCSGHVVDVVAGYLFFKVSDYFGGSERSISGITKINLNHIVSSNDLKPLAPTI